jgi:hypothetical protein
VCPGDRVIFLADPLKYGGELLILGVDPDGRLICEQVHFDDDWDGAVPERPLLWPMEVELVAVWIRQAA